MTVGIADLRDTHEVEAYKGRLECGRTRLGGSRSTDERVAAMLTVLLSGGGRAAMETLAASAGVPAHRMVGTITALRKLLQVEGYPVLEIDLDNATIKLDVALLSEQFELGAP